MSKITEAPSYDWTPYFGPFFKLISFKVSFASESCAVNIVWFPDVDVQSLEPTTLWPLPSIISSLAITIGFVIVISFSNVIVAPESALDITLFKDSSSCAEFVDGLVVEVVALAKFGNAIAKTAVNIKNKIKFITFFILK